MSKFQINTESLLVALGTSVLQWGLDNGFGSRTVSEFYEAISKGGRSPKKKSFNRKKKATKKKATKKNGSQKGNPAAVVKFVKKHGSAKAGDLKGLVPDNANARSLFMSELVAQKLVRRKGKARGTTYYPA